MAGPGASWASEILEGGRTPLLARSAIVGLRCLALVVEKADRARLAAMSDRGVPAPPRANETHPFVRARMLSDARAMNDVGAACGFAAAVVELLVLAQIA